MGSLQALAVVALFLIIAGLLLLYGRTYVVESQKEQNVFMSGIADLSELDGDYQGVAYGYSGSWQGKTIFKNKQSGINRFVYDAVPENKYPFTLSLQQALRDKDKDVIVLDYNQKGNPWWLKYIVDEMVKVGPQQYLGKVHVRLAPGIVFTLGYFSLTNYNP